MDRKLKRIICDDFLEILKKNNKKTMQLRDRKITHKKIHHYTNFDVLANDILKDFCFRLARIDKVNDLIECMKTNIESINNCLKYNTFVACFQADVSESIPMWGLYARDKAMKFEQGIKKGVKIAFNFEEFKNAFENSIVIDNNFRKMKISVKLTQDDCDSFIKSIANKDLKDVIYDDEIINKDLFLYTKQWEPEAKNETGRIKLLNDGRQIYGSIDMFQVGLYKRKAWDYENETRIRVHTLFNGFLPTGKKVPSNDILEYLFIRFSKELFKNANITINPFVSEEEYMELKSKLLRKHKWLNDDQIFKSDLAGSISFK